MKKQTSQLLCSLGIFLAIAGCGKFGEKPDKEVAFNLGASASGDGRLNNLGKTVKKYMEGDITEAELDATWDCVESGHAMLRRFVRGSADDGKGYTQADVRALVANFFITNHDVPASLFKATFALKASVLGGSVETMSPQEFDRLIDLLKVARKQSALLLPYIRRFNHSKDYDGILAFADAIERFAAAFQAGLRVENNPDFSMEDARILVRDFAQLMGGAAPSKLVDLGLASKVLLLGGRPDVFEARIWPRIFRLAGTAGAVAMGFSNVSLFPEKEKGSAIQFHIELARRFKGVLHESLDAHVEANIPLTEIDQLVDSLPPEWFSIDRVPFKAILRPFFNKFFQSLLFDRIDHHSVDEVWAVFEMLGRDQAHLENIFDRSHAGIEGLTRAEILPVMERYLNEKSRTPEEAAEIQRLKGLVDTYKPLYWQNETRVYFGDHENYTQKYFSLLSMVDRLTSRIINVYSGEKRLNQEQFVQFINDYRPMLVSLRAIRPTDQKWPVKRFLEANLFMPSSAGDMLLERSEFSYFLLNIVSMYTMLADVGKEVFPICQLPGEEGKDRPDSDRKCYVREFAKRGEQFLLHFPFLLNRYRTLTVPQKEELVDAFVSGSKQSTDNKEVLSWLDVYASLGFVHFTEGVFQRVDVNKDDIVDVAELEGIYPVYRDLLLGMSKAMKSPFLSDRFLISILTYIFRFGVLPQQSIGGISHFLLWVLAKPNWQIQSDRFIVYKAFSQMAGAL